ncbi:MAG: hypothetical protein ACFFB3_16740, partial [Candidatus Hodarchaeota archaeon]
IIPEEVLEQHISPFIHTPSTKQPNFEDEIQEDIELPEIDIPFNSEHLSEEQRRKSFEPTFFTKLSVLERVRAIEGG